jgi:hypothetical protein
VRTRREQDTQTPRLQDSRDLCKLDVGLREVFDHHICRDEAEALILEGEMRYVTLHPQMNGPMAREGGEIAVNANHRPTGLDETFLFCTMPIG